MKTLAVIMLLVCLFAAVPAAQAQQNPFIIPINFISDQGSFIGQFEVLRFATQGQGLIAVGQLTGTVTNAAGTVLGTVNQRLRLPVLGAAGTCQILDLQIGAIDLNLLGLVVHVDPIAINITAQSGPGNLLGNLLCAVANLLNSQGPLDQLVGLLNKILNLF